jgi:hypothetical protein
MINMLQRLHVSILLAGSFIFCIFLLQSCQARLNGQNKDLVATDEPVTETRNEITVPPAILKLDTFYKKYLDVSGIPIISSAKVPDEALYAVQNMVEKMISQRSDVLAKMIENKIRIGIMAKTEVTTDMPEYRDWNDPDKSEGIDWDTRGRGFGATTELPLMSCAEENLLCYGMGKDWYYNEDIFIHEFAHSIHGLGIRVIDTDIDEELQQALDNAIANGLWKNSYAGTNISEYFAEGVQDWFNVNAEADPSNGTHNEINTREELKNYDRGLYNIIKRYFPENDEKISCHQ